MLDYILKAAEFSYTTISDDFCFIRIPLVPAILNVTLQYITTTKWHMLYSKILWGKNIICIILKYILMHTNKSRVYYIKIIFENNVVLLFPNRSFFWILSSWKIIVVQYSEWNFLSNFFSSSDFLTDHRSHWRWMVDPQFLSFSKKPQSIDIEIYPSQSPFKMSDWKRNIHRYIFLLNK